MATVPLLRTKLSEKSRMRSLPGSIIGVPMAAINSCGPAGMSRGEEGDLSGTVDGKNYSSAQCPIQACAHACKTIARRILCINTLLASDVEYYGRMIDYL